MTPLIREREAKSGELDTKYDAAFDTGVDWRKTESVIANFISPESFPEYHSAIWPDRCTLFDRNGCTVSLLNNLQFSDAEVIEARRTKTLVPRVIERLRRLEQFAAVFSKYSEGLLCRLRGPEGTPEIPAVHITMLFHKIFTMEFVERRQRLLSRGCFLKNKDYLFLVKMEKGEILIFPFSQNRRCGLVLDYVCRGIYVSVLKIYDLSSATLMAFKLCHHPYAALAIRHEIEVLTVLNKFTYWYLPFSIINFHDQHSLHYNANSPANGRLAHTLGYIGKLYPENLAQHIKKNRNILSQAELISIADQIINNVKEHEFFHGNLSLHHFLCKLSKDGKVEGVDLTDFTLTSWKGLLPPDPLKQEHQNGVLYKESLRDLDKIEVRTEGERKLSAEEREMYLRERREVFALGNLLYLLFSGRDDLPSLQGAYDLPRHLCLVSELLKLMVHPDIHQRISLLEVYLLWSEVCYLLKNFEPQSLCIAMGCPPSQILNNDVAKAYLEGKLREQREDVKKTPLEATKQFERKLSDEQRKAEEEFKYDAELDTGNTWQQTESVMAHWIPADRFSVYRSAIWPTRCSEHSLLTHLQFSQNDVVAANKSMTLESQVKARLSRLREFGEIFTRYREGRGGSMQCDEEEAPVLQISEVMKLFDKIFRMEFVDKRQEFLAKGCYLSSARYFYLVKLEKNSLKVLLFPKGKPMTCIGEGSYGKILKVFEVFSAKFLALKLCKVGNATSTSSIRNEIKIMAHVHARQHQPEFLRTICSFDFQSKFGFNNASGEIFKSEVLTHTFGYASQLYKFGHITPFLKYFDHVLLSQVADEVVASVMKSHELKVSHCDLSLDNFFVNFDGERVSLTLGDFGSATSLEAPVCAELANRFHNGHYFEDMVRGSYDESDRKANHNPEEVWTYMGLRDVYSLGVLLFQIFSKKNDPKKRNLPFEVCYLNFGPAHAKEPFVLFKGWELMQYPSQLSLLIQRMLTFDIRQRISLNDVRTEWQKVSEALKVSVCKDVAFDEAQDERTRMFDEEARKLHQNLGRNIDDPFRKKAVEVNKDL